MIIEQEKSNISTNIKKASNFKIQASSKAFEILSSNIYKNKVKAVIREISCNAYDAHIASNNEEAFHVHLPTHIEQWFSVRDFGPGIPEEKMEDVYTTYFYSDKTETNDMIGGLGLGTKSPLCLVDSFVVTSYHNGFRMEYCCFKNDNREPQITLLNKQPTKEKTGLEVKLVVPDSLIEEFEENSVEVFKFFDKTPKINNPEILEVVNKEKLVWANKFCAASTKTISIVMGNVCYEVPDTYEFKVPGSGVYLKAEIGDVNFDPGREYVTLDKKTKQFINSALQNIDKEIVNAASNELNAITCPFQRGKVYQEKYEQFNLEQLYPFINKVNRYIKYYKSYGSMRTEFTNILQYSTKDKSVIYCYSPSGKSRTGKIRHLLNSYSYVCSLNKNDIAQIPKDLLIDLDAYQMPKSIRQRNSSGSSIIGSVYKVDIDTIENSGDIGNILGKSDKIELSTVPQTERFVLQYSAEQIEDISVWDFKELLNICKKENVDLPKFFYMVHYITYKSKRFSSSNHINFLNKIKNDLSHLKNKPRYNDYHIDIENMLKGLKSLKTNCPIIAEKIKELEDAKISIDYRVALQILEVPKKKAICPGIEVELKKAHPIFNLVSMYSLKDNKNILSQYL